VGPFQAGYLASIRPANDVFIIFLIAVEVQSRVTYVVTAMFDKKAKFHDTRRPDPRYEDEDSSSRLGRCSKFRNTNLVQEKKKRLGGIPYR
jgi:hypothetical protein